MDNAVAQILIMSSDSCGINAEMLRKGQNIYSHVTSAVWAWPQAWLTSVSKRFVFKLLRPSLVIVITWKYMFP